MNGCEDLSNPAIEAVVRQWAESQKYVSRVFLFGSRARRKNTPESDVDLAIDVIAHDDTSRKQTYFAWIRPCKPGLERLLGCKVDFAMHPDDNPDDAELQATIKRDMIQLYP
jgi:predicted nucleotidyltransferase